MKRPTAITCIILFILFAIDSKAQHSTINWTEKSERQHFLDREDSTTWDSVLLVGDLEQNKRKAMKPIAYGAFPVPRYNLLGKEAFKGVGNGGNFTGMSVGTKKILYSFFLANKNAITKKFISDKPNEIFFTIIVLTDFIDTINFSHAGLEVISRNNPDYIGQGFFKTKNNEIDYTAFLTATRDEYAIVNMRLFNLKEGRIILIAPQKDGSLRSMQIRSSILSDLDIKNYVEKLLRQDNTKKFFLSDGNI